MKRLLFLALLPLCAVSVVAQDTAPENERTEAETTEADPTPEPTPDPNAPRMEEQVDLAETPGAEDFEIPPPPDATDPDAMEEVRGLLEGEDETTNTPAVTGTVEVTVENAGQIVQARVGNLIRITLESNPSTGYNWELRDFDRGVAGYHSADLVARRDGNVLFGAPADTIITLQALEPGRQDILLVYRRQWEPPDRITDRFGFRLEVTEPPGEEPEGEPAP